MPNLKVEQLKKWRAALPEGWKFDAQYYVLWGEKKIFTYSAENAAGAFYCAELGYRAERVGEGWSAQNTGRQIPTVTVSRYTPTSTGDLCSVVRIFEETAGEPENKKKYDVLCKLAASLDVADYFRRAAEKDTGKQYNDFSDFLSGPETAKPAAEPAAQPAAEAEPETAPDDGQDTAPAAAEEPETVAEAPESIEAGSDSADASSSAETSNNSPVALGMLFEDASGETWEITNLNSMSVDMNGGTRSLYDFGTSRTIGAILNALGPGSRLIPAAAQTAAAPQEVTAEELAADHAPEETPEELPEALPEEPAAEQPENLPAEQAEPETAAEPAENNRAEDDRAEHPAESAQAEPEELAQERAEPAQDEQKAAAAPDMFSQLAAAYFSGKTVKSAQLRKASQAEKKEPEETAQPAETAEPEEPEPAADPEPVPHGYSGNNNNRLPAESRAALAAGRAVPYDDIYHNREILFSAPYADRVRLVYSVHSWDKTRETIEPGKRAEYFGFLVNEDLYTNQKEISEKLTADIEAYLREHVADEAAAAHCAANIDSEYERERLDMWKRKDYHDNARRLFFEGKRPELILYYPWNTSAEEHDYDTLIRYLLEPEATIEAEALRYICEHPEKIYTAYIQYNRLSAAWSLIVSDKNNEEHKLARISRCITDQKTVRIELANGHEVKVDADDVKRFMHWGHISPWSVSAQDRQYLPHNERGRPDDIRADDIVTIRHGGRVLYSAA